MEVRLERVQSHSVGFGYQRQVEREELFPNFTVTVRGQEREVAVEANRYRHSQGMSEWRILVRDVRPGDGVGGATMRQIREAVTPLVESWLESDEYRVSRQGAFARAVSYTIRQMDSTADYRVREALAAFADELTSSDRERLALAAGLRMESLRLLDDRKAVVVDG